MPSMPILITADRSLHIPANAPNTIGVARNNVAAYVWLRRALDRGYSPARALLDQLTSRMTPDQIMAALEKGAE